MITLIDKYREMYLWDISYCLDKAYYWQNRRNSLSDPGQISLYELLSIRRAADAATSALELLVLENVYENTD